MKNVKRMMMVLSLVLGMFMLSKEAQASDGWGKLGDNIDWEFKESKSELIIRGSGDMEVWNSSDIPWLSYQKKIRTVTIQSGVTAICHSAFMDCTNLTKVNIPNTVTKIGSSAFRNTALTSIKFPSSVQTLEGDCFGNTKLKSVTIPGTLKELNGPIFQKCKDLKKVTINPGVKIVGRACFEESGITGIVIPASVEKVGDSVFHNCESLTYVHWKSDSSVEGYTFGNCSNLRAIYFEGNIKEVPYYHTGTFSYCYKLSFIYCPKDSINWERQEFRDVKDLTIYGYKGSSAYNLAGKLDNVSFYDVEQKGGKSVVKGVWNVVLAFSNPPTYVKKKVIFAKSVRKKSIKYSLNVKCIVGKVIYAVRGGKNVTMNKKGIVTVKKKCKKGTYKLYFTDKAPGYTRVNHAIVRVK